MSDEAILRIKKMYRAKVYLDEMRQGIDPVSKLPVPDDSVIRQEKVKNCFFFLSELLDELINEFEPKGEDNVPEELLSGTPEENLEKTAEETVNSTLEPFHMNYEQVKKVTITKKPVAASTFIRNINKALNRKTTRPIRAKDINGWLREKGFIEERAIQIIKEDTEFYPTAQASSVGLLLESKPINNGQADKHFIKFSEAGQQFILDNIDDIAEYAKNNK